LIKSSGALKLVLLALVISLPPVVYAIVTDQLTDDFYITYRFSCNLCEGKGLVYNAGERVHGFTSPLGVLLPALCRFVTPGPSHAPALLLFRLLSAAAFAAGGVFLFVGFGAVTRAASLFAALLVLLYVLDTKGVIYSANGMETGFMLFFLAWSLYLCGREGKLSERALGASWAGLLWTRPDGCVYILALAVALLAFRPGSRRALLSSLLKSGLICAVLYLPWFVWAWRYYGWPVPTTVLAKSAYKTNEYSQYISNALGSLPRLLWERTSLVFGPVNFGFFTGWPEWVGHVSRALSLFCMGYWLLPVRDVPGRQASLTFAILIGYTVFIPVIFPWYLPPIALCGLVVLARSAFELSTLASSRFGLAQAMATGILIILSMGMGTMLGLTAQQMKIQQDVIEKANRIPLGLWLAKNVTAGERVYLEPIGYIGFFSGARILDYPGLVTPEVIRLRKERQLEFASLVPELAPDWIVLRPDEAALMSRYEYFNQHYARRDAFSVRPEVDRVQSLMARSYLEHDATFEVYRKER
jgi:hypothetical protein